MEYEQTEERFSLEELSAKTKVKSRTIRFYIQEGVLMPPEGKGRRWSWYDSKHATRLELLKDLQQRGFSLGEIRERLEELSELFGSGEKRKRIERKPGEISVRSRVLLAHGVELEVDMRESGITSEQLSELRNGCMLVLGHVLNKEEEQ